MSARSLFSLIVFMLVVVAIGSLIGVATAPGPWYADLQKPFFNPPNWLFAPVWLVLYVMIAASGWRIFEAGRNSPAMVLWGAQLLLNWLWSPVFFALHLTWVAFLVILALWAVILAFIITARRVDRFASWLMVPYLLWVTFAGALNLGVAVLN